MVSSGLVSIRTESSDLNISKSGSTSLFVDQNGAAANDANDGFDWDRPFLTIGAALLNSDPWTEIWIRKGTYLENLVVPHQNIKMHGVIQDGTDRAVVSPNSGIPLTLNAGYCEVDGIALVSQDSSAIKCNYPGHYLHDLYIDVMNHSGVSCSGVWLNDSDYTRILGNFLQGNADANVIGVRVDGGSVDNLIGGNYFTGWGAGVGLGANVGYAIGLNDAQRCAILPSIVCGVPIPNRFINNYVGVYFYTVTGYLGHGVQHNLFASNQSYDCYDPNVPTTSGIVLRENCYAYSGWLSDNNHDGRADIMVSAYNNYDHLPLSSPWSWSTAAIPRLSTL